MSLAEGGGARWVYQRQYQNPGQQYRLECFSETTPPTVSDNPVPVDGSQPARSRSAPAASGHRRNCVARMDTYTGKLDRCHSPTTKDARSRLSDLGSWSPTNTRFDDRPGDRRRVHAAHARRKRLVPLRTRVRRRSPPGSARMSFRVLSRCFASTRCSTSTPSCVSQESRPSPVSRAPTGASGLSSRRGSAFLRTRPPAMKRCC